MEFVELDSKICCFPSKPASEWKALLLLIIESLFFSSFVYVTPTNANGKHRQYIHATWGDQTPELSMLWVGAHTNNLVSTPVEGVS